CRAGTLRSSHDSTRVARVELSAGRGAVLRAAPRPPARFAEASAVALGFAWVFGLASALGSAGDLGLAVARDLTAPLGLAGSSGLAGALRLTGDLGSAGASASPPGGTLSSARRRGGRLRGGVGMGAF